MVRILVLLFLFVIGEGGQALVQSVGRTTSQNDDAVMDGSLSDLLRKLFPSQHQRYTLLLVKLDLVTCEAVAELELGDLTEAGFSKPNAKRLLAHCHASSVALCINDISECVGHIQASPLMPLCRVREIIEDGHVPGVPSSYSFTYRGQCVTQQQEQSWYLKQILTTDDKIVVAGITEGELPFTSRSYGRSYVIYYPLFAV